MRRPVTSPAAQIRGAVVRPRRLELVAQERVPPYLGGDFFDAGQQRAVVDRGLTRGKPQRGNRPASRTSRAACANVRTGTGPSLAAMPPNAPCENSAVRAPRRAERSAAVVPAGPAPRTATSNESGATAAIAAMISPKVVRGILRFG
jgi:hypothetical protein